MKLVKPEKADFKPESEIIRKTLTLGLTSFLSQLLSCSGNGSDQ